LRLNKLVVFTARLLTLSPILALVGTTDDGTTTFVAKDYGDTVGVVAGTTIKYNIDALTLPAIPNLTITGLDGNQLYVKVMAVEDDHAFSEFVTGTLISYGLGLILLDDVSLTIGEGFTALDLILPIGSATPAITLSGAPHFNGSQPAFFFLDNGWTEHALILGAFGMTIDTNDVDTLSVSAVNGSGSVSMTWRKSDGLLTDLLIDDISFFGVDFYDATIDISLATVDTTKGLDLTIGQEIALNADIAYLNVEGTGEYFAMLNQSDIISIEEEILAMEGQTILKYVITDIEGLYYTATVYTYDIETNSLVASIDDYLFCGFLGGYQMTEPPLFELGVQYMPIYAPAITADYDIYTGYMVLADTIVGVYLDDIMALMGDDLFGTDISLDTIDGDFDIYEKKGYFFLQQSLTADVTAGFDLTITLEGMLPQETATLGIDVSVFEEGWIGYAEDGILAGLRMNLDVNVELTTEYASLSPISAGTISITFDFKLVNPDYNPPDPIGGGILPGFTWLVSIPAILSVAAIGAIIRKRK